VSDQELFNLFKHRNHQPIFIVGPTATGKSSLATAVSNLLKYDVLSADSRQVYTGLEITSGADISASFSKSTNTVGGFQYFSNQSNSYYGLSMLNPDQEWSIAHFHDYAKKVIEHTQTEQRTLLIVGGSGLYLHSLFLDSKQLHIAPNRAIRSVLENESVEELQQRVVAIDSNVKERMNHSDWHNPRRLIRLYEKNLTGVSPHSDETQQVLNSPEAHTWIGVHLEKEIIKENIQKRVIERITQGAIQEVEKLLSDYSQKFPALSTTGVKEIIGYLNDNYDKDTLIELWSLREFQYAKRQLTWFKKRSYIQWTDISS